MCGPQGGEDTLSLALASTPLIRPDSKRPDQSCALASRGIKVESGPAGRPALHAGEPGAATDEGHVALHLAGLGIRFAAALAQARQVGAGGDGGDQVLAGLGA